jgi:hypothetical protein
VKCPTCQAEIPDDQIIRAGMSALGKRGKGEKKARTTQHCRAAAKKMWANRTHIANGALAE